MTEAGKRRVFSCRLPEGCWEKFRRLARQYGMSQSELLEELVKAMPEPSAQTSRFVVHIEDKATPATSLQDRHLRTVVVGGT